METDEDGFVLIRPHPSLSVLIRSIRVLGRAPALEPQTQSTSALVFEEAAAQEALAAE